MKTIVIGTGTLGSALADLFRSNGHDVIGVGRTTGDAQADITDIDSLEERQQEPRTPSRSRKLPALRRPAS
jgi:nucleoside-diphosphate-sugar epimerase